MRCFAGYARSVNVVFSFAHFGLGGWAPETGGSLSSRSIFPEDSRGSVVVTDRIIIDSSMVPVYGVFIHLDQV